jgi:hypothetical protein
MRKLIFRKPTLAEQLDKALIDKGIYKPYLTRESERELIVEVDDSWTDQDKQNLEGALKVIKPDIKKMREE